MVHTCYARAPGAAANVRKRQKIAIRKHALTTNLLLLLDDYSPEDDQRIPRIKLG
jgi:hypothetical protein